MEEAQNLVRIPLIGELAPAFKAKSTHGVIEFPKDYQNKYVVFFSHPADFTPICSSEFMLFAQHYQKFKTLKTELIGISADSLYSHIAWLKDIKERLEYKGNKSQEIPFPVITDMDKSIIKQYGMIHANNEFATRSTFIIDPKGRIKAFMFYPMYNGRSIKEILRLLQGIQRNDQFSVATPADWNPGEDVIDRIPRSFDEALEKESLISKKNPEKKCFSWYSCFRPDLNLTDL